VDGGNKLGMRIFEEAYSFWNSPLCRVLCSSDVTSLGLVVLSTLTSDTSNGSSIAF
jgi:hypothetical protein